nr:hypothetical protein [Tanacetum cinerariifolium]
MTNGREITPPPGFSVVPTTTSMFAATTPENTPLGYRASTSTNPNPMISPAFVEANYETLESLLRDRRRQMCNNDFRTELKYSSEDYDEEREMKPRPKPARAFTPPLRPASPRVHRRRERVVGFEETQNKGTTSPSGKRGDKEKRKDFSHLVRRKEERKKSSIRKNPYPYGKRKRPQAKEETGERQQDRKKYVSSHPKRGLIRPSSNQGVHIRNTSKHGIFGQRKLMQRNIRTMLPKVETINQISSSGLQYSHRRFFGRRVMAVRRNTIRSHNRRRSPHDHEDTYICNHKLDGTHLRIPEGRNPTKRSAKGKETAHQSSAIQDDRRDSISKVIHVTMVEVCRPNAGQEHHKGSARMVLWDALGP